jgi:uncharacterized membrane protein YhaH (DUF805 family)
MYENSFTFTKMLAAYTKPHRFDGRSTRTELLGYMIVSWFIAALIERVFIIGGIAFSPELDFDLATINWIYLIFWLPFPALAVRRFHDQDKPGLWVLPLVLPTVLVWLGLEGLTAGKPIGYAIGAIYLVALVLLVWKPTDGTNRYGPDPRLDPEDFDEAVSDA